MLMVRQVELLDTARLQSTLRRQHEEEHIPTDVGADPHLLQHGRRKARTEDGGLP